LERLVENNEISRAARGIYSRLIVDLILGEIKPSTKSIAKAISKRNKVYIIPTGVLALNALGLLIQILKKII